MVMVWVCSRAACNRGRAKRRWVGDGLVLQAGGLLQVESQGKGQARVAWVGGSLGGGQEGGPAPADRRF